MGDSLQDYFSNLLGCSNTGDATLIVDNAKPRSSATSETSLDWLMECCSVDTTNSCSSYNSLHSLSRWESIPTHPHQPSTPGVSHQKGDFAIQRPRRRTLSWNDDSDNDINLLAPSAAPPADYTAIFPSSGNGALVQEPLSTTTMSRPSQSPRSHSPSSRSRMMGGQLHLSRH